MVKLDTHLMLIGFQKDCLQTLMFRSDQKTVFIDTSEWVFYKINRSVQVWFLYMQQCDHPFVRIVSPWPLSIQPKAKWTLDLTVCTRDFAESRSTGSSLESDITPYNINFKTSRGCVTQLKLSSTWLRSACIHCYSHNYVILALGNKTTPVFVANSRLYLVVCADI